MVFQILINGHVMCPNLVWSCGAFDDQARSCVIFPGSRAVRSCDQLGAGRSCDLSRDGSCDRFLWSRVLEITWLELGLGVVRKRLVIVKWVLGSFGNVFLVGASFACNIILLSSPYHSLPKICDEYCPVHVHISLVVSLIAYTKDYKYNSKKKKVQVYIPEVRWNLLNVTNWISLHSYSTCVKALIDVILVIVDMNYCRNDYCHLIEQC